MVGGGGRAASTGKGRASRVGTPPSVGGGGGPASGSGGQTKLVRSARRRARSLIVRNCPEKISNTVVPKMKGDSPASDPGGKTRPRGVIWRKPVFTSGPWHPLHVFSDAWK